MKLKMALFCGAFLALGGAAHAEDYAKIHCSDLLDEANWPAHVVGWLNLQNRDGTTQEMDFGKANAAALRLQHTCITQPDLMLHQAVASTFSEIDDEGAQQPVSPKLADHAAIDPAPIGSVMR